MPPGADTAGCGGGDSAPPPRRALDALGGQAFIDTCDKNIKNRTEERSFSGRLLVVVVEAKEEVVAVVWMTESGRSRRLVLGSIPHRMEGMWLFVGFIQTLTAAILLGQVQRPPEEFCQWDTFNASCASDDVILMTSAFYGRMKVGRCITIDYHVDCKADVLEQVEARCSGRRSCTVSIPDQDLFRVQPCRKDLVAYFEASYACVRVSGLPPSVPKDAPSGKAASSACDESTISLPTPSGYLASYTARLPGAYGTQRCPWVLRAPTGQRINVTLHDFTAPRVQQGSADGRPRHPATPVDRCPPMVVFQETGNPDHVVRSCDSRLKRRLVYVSHGNVLRVFVANGTTDDTIFLLHYQVTGCASLLNLSKEASASRRGDTLLVSCNHSSEKWHLVCRGNDWIGSYGNCSNAITTHTEEARVNPQQFPIGLLVAIAIGAIVGVAIGCTFLLMVFVFRKRFYRQRASNEAVLMDLYKSRDNVYKTIDLRSASLPAEMTCMLDVIGGTPSTTATPARCDCVGGGGGLRMSPSGGPADGACPVSCNGSPAGHGIPGPGRGDEVYFSEEVLRQTLGRCRTRSPRSAGGGVAAGGASGASGDPSPLVDATSSVSHAAVSRQVSPSSSPPPSFLLGKGQTTQQQPQPPPLGTFRGFFSPYPTSATNEEKVYEAPGTRRQLAPNPSSRTS